GSPRDLPVPAERAWVRARVSDHAGTGRALAFLPLPILPSTKSTASALRICAFRGSMAGPHLPLSTLRRAPHGTLRMTRGQCGSLYLSLCKTFTHYSLPVSRRTDVTTVSFLFWISYVQRCNRITHHSVLARTCAAVKRSRIDIVFFA